MESSNPSSLPLIWFCLIGLMLVFYVVSDGFDLGVGILTLFQSSEPARGTMLLSIGHVWDANETWLVVLGGALFGAFPSAYATILQDLYIPIMFLIAALIMRGASIEFRHVATNKRIWDLVFGAGSLLAALCQGVVLGRVLTGFESGPVPLLFVAITAIGVVSGYVLLGATYLVSKTGGELALFAQRAAMLTVFTTVAAAAILSVGTITISSVGHERWSQPGIFHVLRALSAGAILSFTAIVAFLKLGSDSGPFRGAVALFLFSFSGLAISFYPYLIPGKLSVFSAASDGSTLMFMLFGIGAIFPVMIGYNLYQYYLFRGKVDSIPINAIDH